MPKYALAFNGEPITTFGFGTGNADDLERDEFDALKRLGQTRRFSFEEADRQPLPQAERDPLDDIALEQVGARMSGDIGRQAARRVEERGLCR
jgi:hypothetical protein